jgi:hypothetical protein
MVYQDSVPFCAPSQLRLQGVLDGEGVAWFAVLDAYNQPIGNLNAMKIPIEELRAVCAATQETATASSEKSTCTFHMGSDNAHQMLAVDYEDPERYMKRSATVRLEDFRELVESMKPHATA